jgi:hypothetical protein
VFYISFLELVNVEIPLLKEETQLKNEEIKYKVEKILDIKIIKEG